MIAMDHPPSITNNESSIDGGSGDPFLTEDDDVIRLEELNLVPLNRPDKTRLLVQREADHIFIQEEWNVNNWETLGRDIAGNDYLREITIGTPDRSITGALSDQNMSALFQGLTRSNSVRSMTLYGNRFGVEGVQAMTPFLENSSNLISLNVSEIEIGSEGFSLLWGALRDSPIEKLWCGWCGVDNLEIDENCIPECLRMLSLSGNNIGTDGCRELAKLFLKKDSMLESLFLGENNIDDEGVAILVDDLRNNTSLTHLHIEDNERISMKGKSLLLKLVNDISSIKATLESNHTLISLGLNFDVRYRNESCVIVDYISAALDINRSSVRKKDTGKWKVISTQLNSEERFLLCRLQEVDICNDALFSEINPLHLPEVFELVGCNHGHGELYVALRSSIAGLFSTINKKKRLQDCLKHHLSIIERLRNEIAAIEEAEENLETGNESRSVGFKRPRTS